MRRALHIGNQALNRPATVKWYLREEGMKTIEPWILEVMLVIHFLHDTNGSLLYCCSVRFRLSVYFHGMF